MSTKVVIYGFQLYTDAWVKVKRAYKGFELVPAKDLSALQADLAKYPKLKFLAIACWNEMILSTVDGLHVVETLPPLVSEVYTTISTLARTLSIKVNLNLLQY